MRHDHAWVVVAEAPERCTVGLSGRAAQQVDRTRRLTPEDRDVIRSLAKKRSLRDLAATFGASHETVRNVLRLAGEPDPRMASV